MVVRMRRVLLDGRKKMLAFQMAVGCVMQGLGVWGCGSRSALQGKWC